MAEISASSRITKSRGATSQVGFWLNSWLKFWDRIKDWYCLLGHKPNFLSGYDIFKVENKIDMCKTSMPQEK